MELTNEQLKNRIAWVKALRGRKFTQGHGYLKIISGYVTKHCCLGVACELNDPLHHQLEVSSLTGHSTVKLSEDTLALYGLTIADQTRAINWNDVERLPFKRIADHIAYATEHNLPFDDVQSRKIPENYSKGWLLVQWWHRRGNDSTV